jgi:hypothetical protein
MDICSHKTFVNYGQKGFIAFSPEYNTVEKNNIVETIVEEFYLKFATLNVHRKRVELHGTDEGDPGGKCVHLVAVLQNFFLHHC